jgi:hypothetical protein
MISTYVDGPMNDGGFRKIRKHFWITESPDGNCVIVRIRLYDLGEEECGFHVEWAAVPALLREFYHGDPAQNVRFEWGLINTRFDVPEERRLKPYFTNLWWFLIENIDEFGGYFQDLLKEIAVPLWKSALNAAGIREILASPSLKHGNQPAVADPTRVELVLRFNDASKIELAALVNTAKENFPSSEFLNWVEEKLAHGPPRQDVTG